MGRLLARKLLVERLVRPRLADGIFVEEYKPLQIHFAHAGLGGDAHEVRQLLDGFAHAGEPCRDARLGSALALLQFAEGAHILEDAVEIILAADGAIGFGVGGVERDAQFVEPGLDQRAAVLFVEHGAVGVEQHVGAAILQIAHHARQVLDQHRLADAV